jgi:thiopeptide-type bacteriocin biosynthesis protein
VTTVDHVLAVLAGTPLLRAAADARMDPTDLAEAVGAFRSAGRAAVQAHADHRWHEIRVQFSDFSTAEAVATDDLGPALDRAQEARVITAWWYIRKAPCWRIRYRRGPGMSTARLTRHITAVMDDVVRQGTVARWRSAIYEPEACAFGGPTGMDVAHRLFHADTLGILDHLHRQTAGIAVLGRREVSVLLCTALFRGARQEWHEQGDVWHRVADMRPLPADTSTERLHTLADSLLRLLAADLSPAGRPVGLDAEPASIAPWLAAFTAAGRDLAAAVDDTTLHRGIRDVLAHHVIFHWNRLGVPDRAQAILARAAHDIVMNPPGRPRTMTAPTDSAPDTTARVNAPHNRARFGVLR